MLIDAGFEGSLSECSKLAESVQNSSHFAGFWVNDTSNDPFLLAALAVENTESITVGTNIAVAFARSPYALAQTAYNLAQLSKGRFVLGLGSQVKAHIEKRFSMTWPEKPVAALKEYVVLLRYLFTCFNSSERPNFRGDYFRCTLNSPVFNPERHEFSLPSVGFSAVGPVSTRAAGEVAQAVFLHPFTHLEYLKNVTLPALEQGKIKRDQSLGDLEVVGSCFCLNTDRPDYARKKREVRARLAFYASTPNYGEVVDSLGFEGLKSELHALSRQGRWDEMADALPEEFVAACVVEGDRDTILKSLRERFSGIYTRVVIDPMVL